MKIDWNRKYTTIAIYAGIVGALLVLVVAVVFNLSDILGWFGVLLSIMSPFLWGFALAYVLNRPLNFFDRVFAGMFRKKPRPKAARGMAVCVVVVLFLAVFAGLIWILIPQLAASIISLVNSLPEYFQGFREWLFSTLRNLRIDTSSFNEWMLTWEGLVDKAVEFAKSILPNLADVGINVTITAVSAVANAFLALISSIYLMLSKERFIMQFKKLLFGLMPKTFTEKTILVMRDSHSIFSKFIAGKLLESLIVGVVTAVSMMIVGSDYALLVGVIMGLFNIIPFIGPFIGAVPCALILLITDPMHALLFVIFTIVLQQIDGQILGPRILGNSTGLTAFWVLFAIIVGGGLFGVLGMILGIPVFAVLYSVLREFTNAQLRKKGLSTDPKDYQSDKKKI